MTIYYLMVKTHNITGLKYLCQTKRKDPHKYLGSGLHWERHLNKHGKDITTEIIRECQSKDELKEWESITVKNGTLSRVMNGPT